MRDTFRHIEWPTKPNITPYDTLKAHRAARVLMDSNPQHDGEGGAPSATPFDIIAPTPAPSVPHAQPEQAQKAPARYRSLFTGQWEERYDPTPRDYQPADVTPVNVRRLSQRMQERATSHMQGEALGFYHAVMRRKVDMGLLGSKDPWLAQGYRVGYATGEREHGHRNR